MFYNPINAHYNQLNYAFTQLNIKHSVMEKKV